jgi:hypothetical protein
MPIQLVALPPSQVVLDETRFPDDDDSWIYEHLLHYCSLFDPLPAITVFVEPDGPALTRGHKYLRIARELERPRIRAVIDPASDERAVSGLTRRPDVETLDWAEIDRRERATPVAEVWHVFYFERPLTDEEKLRFTREVADFFEDLGWAARERARIGEVRHNDEERRAEFLARTPVADESWYAKYLATMTHFSREVVPIVSYQGRRFGG